MLTISTLSLSRLKAARHVAFHKAVLTIIQNQGADRLGLTEGEVQAYTDAIAAEQDWVNVAFGSEYTTRMEQRDAERKAVAQDILYRLAYSRYSSSSVASAAFESAKQNILDRYKGIAALDYSARTATIAGLLMDLDKMNPAVLQALGIDELAKTLTDANDNFTRAFLSRNAQRVRLAGTLSECRKACDTLYTATLCTPAGLANLSDGYIQAIADAAQREKMAATRDLAATFVKQVNEVINYFNTQYLKSGAKTAGAGEGTDPDYTDPDATPDGAGDTTPPDGAGDAQPGTGPTDVTEVFG